MFTQPAQIDISARIVRLTSIIGEGGGDAGVLSDLQTAIDDASAAVANALARANAAFAESANVRAEFAESDGALDTSIQAVISRLDNVDAALDGSLVEIGDRLSASFGNQISDLGAAVQQAQSELSQLSSSNASAHSAITEQITSLTASYGALNSSYNQYVQTQSNAFQSLSLQVQQLTSENSDTRASLQQLSQTVANLDGGSVRWAVRGTVGNNQSLLGLEVTENGSSAFLSAQNIYMGDSTRFDDQHDAFITERSGVRYMDGAGFGQNNDLLTWVGPGSVPLGQETTSNGRFALSINDTFINGQPLPFTARPNSPFIYAFGSNNSPGSATAKMNPVGGKGPFTYQWQQATGVKVNVINEDQQQCTIMGTGPLGSGMLMCIIHDLGRNEFTQGFVAFTMDSIGGIG